MIVQTKANKMKTMNIGCLAMYHLITGEVPDPWHSCVQLFKGQDLELLVVDDGSSKLQFPVHSGGHISPAKIVTSTQLLPGDLHDAPLFKIFRTE
jgi:hypothetical protein